MTIDEAIAHAEEVANDQELKSGFETDYETYRMSDDEREECKKCAAEHRQLAEWLKDYKRLLEQKQKTGHWIEIESVGNDNYRFKCSECDHTDFASKNVKVNYCWFCGSYNGGDS